MENPQTIISRLKFIGRIKIGEKINTHGTFVQPDHFVTAISRTFWHQDNRGNAYSYISETVTKSFDLLNQYRNSSKETERLMLRNILADLKQAKVGILNLKITYAKDAKFCCDLDTLIQNMEAYLIPYQKTIEQYVSEYSSPFQLASESSQNQVSTSPPGSHVNISVSARQGTIDVQNNQNLPVSGMLAKQLSEIASTPVPTPLPSPVPVPSPVPSPVPVPMLFTSGSDPTPAPFTSSNPIPIPDRRSMNVSAEESV